MTTLEIGALLEGRYRLDGILGQGGMATVFHARDTRLDRAVAVKVLRPEVLADPTIALRFQREAHAATVLRHPNIVACLSVGTERNIPFLVMELVEGEDPASRIRRDAPLSLPAALRIVADVGLGLGVAHARGFVHRDVKPGNILIAGDGRAMVTDFGIDRLIAETDAEATSTGTTLGSVHYLSPEQVSGGTATAASDVYGLGLVLYEMLTGVRAWTGDSPAAIALARVHAPAPSVQAIRPDVPDEVEAIVGRALDPAPRPLPEWHGLRRRRRGGRPSSRSVRRDGRRGGGARRPPLDEAGTPDRSLPVDQHRADRRRQRRARACCHRAHRRSARWWVRT